MKTIIFNPKPYANDYVSKMYFGSLSRVYRYQQIERASDISNLRNSIILIDSSYLVPEAISVLKNNGNKIVAFDINDSSQMTYTYNSLSIIEDIDLIFKVSGLQKTLNSDELIIDSNFGYRKEAMPFCQDPGWWDIYSKLRDSGRIMSLPYVPWHRVPISDSPYCEKRQEVLVRGGNHYYRFHLFLNLLRHGLSGLESAFCTNEYFKPEMAPQFRYCQDCIDTRNRFGKIPYSHYAKTTKHRCNNQHVRWGGEINDNFFNQDPGQWNNRCIPMFYWLADKFEERHGPIDKALLENALNGTFLIKNDFHDILNRYVAYADFKWIFSIYAPPRFWEAAAIGSVNVVSSRVNDQSFFPAMYPDEHYLTFSEDFSDIGSLNITKDKYEHITHNAKELYKKYILSDSDFEVNKNLTDYIVSAINNTVNQ